MNERSASRLSGGAVLVGGGTLLGAPVALAVTGGATPVAPVVGLVAAVVVVALLARLVPRVGPVLVVLGALGGTAAGWATVDDQSEGQAYEIPTGPVRPQLDDLAGVSPNRTIVGQLTVLYELEDAIPGARLRTTSQHLAGRLRAFTTLDAVVGDVGRVPEVPPTAPLGFLHDQPVYLVGEGPVYEWRQDVPGPVVVVGVRR